MTGNYTRVSVSFRYLVSDEVMTNLLLLWACVWFVIIVMGLLFNGLIIRAFLRIGLKDSITTSFFFLAVSDFAHVLFPIAIVIIHVFMYTEESMLVFFPVQPLLLFVIFVNLTSTFNNLTTFITTFLAVQRCLCIIRPLHFKGMLTPASTWVIMAIFVVVSFMPAVAHLFAFSIESLVNPVNNKTQFIVVPTSEFQNIDYFVQTYFMTSLVTSHVLIFGSLMIMGYGLKASLKFRGNIKADAIKGGQDEPSNRTPKNFTDPQADPRKQESKERVAIVQVSLLCCIFLITNLPKLGLAIANVASADMSLNGRYKNLYMTFVNIRITFDYINSAVNFPIYYRFNSRFRSVCFKTAEKRETAG